MNHSHVFWDWNGTLFDDFEANFLVINTLLCKYGLPAVNKTSYKEMFQFPIINFYKSLGFDCSPLVYDELVENYWSLYNIYSAKVKFSKSAERVLGLLQKANIPQLVLSSCNKTVLLKQINTLNISHYFQDILAPSDKYAVGKQSLAEMWLIENSISTPANILLIGDTIYDHMVATNIGFDSLLITSGHQDLTEIAYTTNAKIVDSLEEIIPYL